MFAIAWTESAAPLCSGGAALFLCVGDGVRAVPYKTAQSRDGALAVPAFTCLYTYRWVVTSNTPRVVMRRLGITGSAMKLSVMNGSMPLDTPSS